MSIKAKAGDVVDSWKKRRMRKKWFKTGFIDLKISHLAPSMHLDTPTTVDIPETTNLVIRTCGNVVLNEMEVFH